MPGFMLLNDPTSRRQLLVRADHVTSAEVRREDGIVVLRLINGLEMTLSHEESRQFLRHAHPSQRKARARAKARAGSRPAIGRRVRPPAPGE